MKIHSLLDWLHYIGVSDGLRDLTEIYDRPEATTDLRCQMMSVGNETTEMRVVVPLRFDNVYGISRVLHNGY